MSAEQPLKAELIGWSIGNAAVLACAGVAVVMGFPLALFSAASAISFAVLIHRGRGRWTPHGRFGAANAITFARIAGILALPWLAPGVLAGAIALILFALDGVDGRIARRAGLAGPFGAFADKEGDALLVLTLCVLLYRLPGGLGPWVLIPGLLRYGFVLFIALARPPEPQEVRTAKGVWIAGLTTAALIATLAAYPEHFAQAAWLAAAASALLCYSFAESTWRVYHVAAPAAK